MANVDDGMVAILAVLPCASQAGQNNRMPVGVGRSALALICPF